MQNILRTWDLKQKATRLTFQLVFITTKNKKVSLLMLQLKGHLTQQRISKVIEKKLWNKCL